MKYLQLSVSDEKNPNKQPESPGENNFFHKRILSMNQMKPGSSHFSGDGGGRSRLKGRYRSK